jgi:hypothetical protein
MDHYRTRIILLKTDVNAIKSHCIIEGKYPAYGRSLGTVSLKEPVAVYDSELLETLIFPDNSFLECYAIGSNRTKYLFIHKDTKNVYLNLRFMDVEDGDGYTFIKNCIIAMSPTIKGSLAGNTVVGFNMWCSGSQVNELGVYCDVDMKMFEGVFGYFLENVNKNVYKVAEYIGPSNTMPDYKNGEYPVIFSGV